MAGWTVTSWVNADWAAVGTVNDFRKAISERNLALDEAAWSDISAGEDVQDHAFWESMQDWVEGVFEYFIPSHSGGTPKTPSDYDGDSTLETYQSLAEVFAAAGLGHSNWRRYTTHLDDGGTVAYGKIQAGDIIGPWLFEDLQDCLNVLIWTLHARNNLNITGLVGDAAWRSTVDDATRRYYVGNGLNANFGTAKTQAETNWQQYTSTGNEPHAYSWAEYNQMVFKYAAKLDRVSLHAFVSGLPTSLAREASFFIYTEPQSASEEEIFDDNDDDVIEDAWSLWDTNSAASGIMLDSTDRIGATADAKPAWCNQPSAEAYHSKTRGWTEINVAAIVRYDVSEGFDYC